MDHTTLVQRYGSPPPIPDNNTICQMHKDASQINSSAPALWLSEWMEIELSTGALENLRLRMKRVYKKCASLRGNKREEFLAQLFILPSTSTSSSSLAIPTTSTTNSASQTDIAPDCFDHQKKINALGAEIVKKEKTLKAIVNRIKDADKTLAEKMQEEIYFKKRNVLAREARLKETIVRQRRDNMELRKRVREMEVDCAKYNVVKEQKMKSHYKIKAEKRLKEVKRLRQEVKKLRKENRRVEVVDDAGDGGVDEGDVFGEDVRLCVYDLLGLEVGIEKMSPVIEAVARHIFNVNLSSLPSRQTVLRMADEAHYLAKKYYAYRLKTADSFGIKKDGTTRQKVNILDTSLTLDNGEVLPLGFKRVARETAQAITDVTIGQLEELKQSSKVEDDQWNGFLSKVSFIMTDRAANEKLSNKQLDAWVQAQLTEGDLPETKIHIMYCMVHVLLGFQREVLQEVNSAQKMMEMEGGKLGRDVSNSFATWRFQNVANRLIKNACDTLGPNGDEKCGVRCKWLAECRMRNLKSYIGDYRDNRFNGIFECAAQVLHHIDDILTIEKRLPKDVNLKVKSVLLDLKDSRAVTVLQAYVLFYFKVTEPYRIAIMSKGAVYLRLGPSIQTMRKSLLEVEGENCKSRSYSNQK